MIKKALCIPLIFPGWGNITKVKEPNLLVGEIKLDPACIWEARASVANTPPLDILLLFPSAEIHTRDLRIDVYVPISLRAEQAAAIGSSARRLSKFGSFVPAERSEVLFSTGDELDKMLDLVEGLHDLPISRVWTGTPMLK